MKYEVEVSYTAPFWDTIEVEGVSKEDAELVAKQHMEAAYPEALDVSIDKIKEVN